MKIKDLLNEGWKVIKPGIAKNSTYEADLVLNSTATNQGEIYLMVYVPGSNRKVGEHLLYRGDTRAVSMDSLVDRAKETLNLKHPAI